MRLLYNRHEIHSCGNFQGTDNFLPFEMSEKHRHYLIKLDSLVPFALRWYFCQEHSMLFVLKRKESLVTRIKKW